MKPANPPVTLTVAGFDPSGGAGVIADIKTMTAFGCFPTAVLTALTFQNTNGVFGVRKQSAEDLQAQLIPVIEDFEIAAMKTGMLPSGSIISAIARLVDDGKLPAPVVDPVVVATSGDRLIPESAVRALIKELLPLSRIVTPNIPEAELLTGRVIETEADMCQAVEHIAGLGPRAVLLKGGHRPAGPASRLKDPGTGEERYDSVALDILWENGQLMYFRAPRIRTTSTHGTGCTLSAAIAAGLAQGQTLHAAISAAKSFVHRAIERAPGIGKGSGPIDHGWQSRSGRES